MQKYDFILAGGGLAGLSLAFYLNETSLKNKKIAIIDRDEKNKNDRTWCFWADKPTAFETVIIKHWQQVHFFGQDFDRKIHIAPFKYNMVRGADFYAFVKNKLKQNPNIDWVYGEVESIDNRTSGAVVSVNGQEFFGHFVFNSIFDIKDFQKEKDAYFYQLQHFKGWVIETETPVFDPQKIHLMDFRTEQERNARFFYVLPLNEKKALIEYTIFSDTLLAPENYDDFLNEYIKKTLQIPHFSVLETEYGIIPMTNFPFKRQPATHIINIGTIGGDVKSSSGYAFFRVQEAMQQIAQQLEKTGQPVPKKSWFQQRFRIYDTLILHILQTKGELIKPIFTKLFKNNSIQNVFNFLNEKTHLLQEIRIFLSLPHPPFWKGIFSVYFKKR